MARTKYTMRKGNDKPPSKPTPKSRKKSTKKLTKPRTIKKPERIYHGRLILSHFFDQLVAKVGVAQLVKMETELKRTTSQMETWMKEDFEDLDHHFKNDVEMKEFSYKVITPNNFQNNVISAKNDKNVRHQFFMVDHVQNGLRMGLGDFKVEDDELKMFDCSQKWEQTRQEWQTSKDKDKMDKCFLIGFVNIDYDQNTDPGKALITCSLRLAINQKYSDLIKAKNKNKSRRKRSREEGKIGRIILLMVFKYLFRKAKRNV